MLQIRHKAQGIIIFIASIIVLFYVRLNTCSGECSIFCDSSCLAGHVFVEFTLELEIAC